MKWRSRARVRVPAWRVRQGQLLCKLSYPQLPLAAKKINFISRLDVNFLDSTPNFDRAGLVAEWLRRLISLSPLIIWSSHRYGWCGFDPPHWLHVGKVKFYLQVCQVVLPGVLPFSAQPIDWLVSIWVKIILKVMLNWIKKKKKNWQSQLSVKWRSRAPGHDACLKSVSRTITMQGFILTDSYHCCREINFIFRLEVNFVDLMQNFNKVQWSMKWRSRAPGQGACLKSVPRTITMQAFIPTATTAAAKKLTLFSRLDVIF